MDKQALRYLYLYAKSGNDNNYHRDGIAISATSKTADFILLNCSEYFY